MKAKVTQKKVRNLFKKIYYAKYYQFCAMYRERALDEPLFYTSGIHGWNADVYYLDRDTALVMGFRPFGTDYLKTDEEVREVIKNHGAYRGNGVPC